MSKRIISGCDLNFHGIKKVSFQVRGPYMGSEVLKVHFEDCYGDIGTLTLFCDPIVRVESVNPLKKLKRIFANIGGLKLEKEKA